jgi:hypothetical protein
MANVSRPLIGLLVATVAFFAVWVVALKPSASTSGGGSPSSGALGAYQSAIAKAHQAVGTSNAASVAHGGTVATAAAPATATATVPAHPVTATTAANAASTPRAAAKPAAAQAVVVATTSNRVNAVQSALRANKVLALLFFNPAAADDKAVKQELAAVPTHGAQVAKLAVPLAELAHYAFITSQVPVTGSPTLVLVDHARHATTIVGFADRFEIAQRVSDALAVK